MLEKNVINLLVFFTAYMLVFKVINYTSEIITFDYEPMSNEIMTQNGNNLNIV